MSKPSFKQLSLAAIVLLILIVVLQNTAQVETKILFATMTMPRALLLAITFLLGVVFGLLWAARRAGRARSAEDA